MKFSAGVSTGAAHSRARTSHEEEAAAPAANRGAIAGSTMLVRARTLCTKFAGGSTSAKPFSQVIPDWAWVNRGPQSLHAEGCAGKASSSEPAMTPSRASERRASKSEHFIPFWFWYCINSPAYRYVIISALVPFFLD